MSGIRYLINLTFAIALCNSTYAQDSLKKSTISLGIGTNYIINKDEFQSPYNYKATNLLIKAAYSRIGPKGQHQLDFAYSAGQLQSSVSPKANSKLFSFNYDYLFRIKPGNRAGRFNASLGFGLHTFLSNTNYLPNVELSKNYLSGYANLTLSGSALYNINRNSAIKLQMGLSVAGFVYRPDFEINGNVLTQIALIGKNNLLSARLEHDYKLTSKLSFMAAFNYYYFTFNEPRPVTILQNGLLIGFTYRLP